jgi:hypothetical protein
MLTDIGIHVTGVQEDASQAIGNDYYTRELCGLGPQVYLQYVLERIAERAMNRMDKLLLWNVAEQTAS